jgi:hypothetical protein
MPWLLSWKDAEETIVLFEPADPWEWEDYFEVAQQAQEWIREKGYVVDTIYQLPGRIRLPGGSILSRLREVYATDPENSGMVVVIGASHLIETFVGVITAAMGGASRFRFVSSMDDALAEIEQARAKRSTR